MVVRRRYRPTYKRKLVNKKTRYIVIGVIAVLMYFFIQGDQGFLKYVKLQREKKLLLIQIEELKRENEALVNEIDLLTHNYRYIEKSARERLHMGKEGEKLYLMTPAKE